MLPNLDKASLVRVTAELTVLCRIARNTKALKILWNSLPTLAERKDMADMDFYVWSPTSTNLTHTFVSVEDGKPKPFGNIPFPGIEQKHP